MNHLEFASMESSSAAPCAWELWASAVESLLGHSLDGDQAEDGYSMDAALDAWRGGGRAEAHAAAIIAKRPTTPTSSR